MKNGLKVRFTVTYTNLYKHTYFITLFTVIGYFIRSFLFVFCSLKNYICVCAFYISKCDYQEYKKAYKIKTLIITNYRHIETENKIVKYEK